MSEHCDICGCVGFHDLTCHDEVALDKQREQPITTELLLRWRMQCLIAEPVKEATHIEWFPVKDGKIVPIDHLSRGLGNQLNVKVLAMELSWKRLIILIDRYLAWQKEDMELPQAKAPPPITFNGVPIQHVESLERGGEGVFFDITDPKGHDPSLWLAPPSENVEPEPAPGPPPLPNDVAIQDLVALGGASVPLAVIRTWSEEAKREAVTWVSQVMEAPDGAAVETPKFISLFF